MTETDPNGTILGWYDENVVPRQLAMENVGSMNFMQRSQDLLGYLDEDVVHRERLSAS